MLIQTDYSLFSSALTIKKGVSLAEKTCVLCDKNLFAVPQFVYECRAKNKKPVIALQKEISGAKYLFIALNEEGYKSLIEYESLGVNKNIFNDTNILALLIEIIDLEQEIIEVPFALNTTKFMNVLIKETFPNIKILRSSIINAEKDSDIYTIGLIKSIGDKKGFDETVINVDIKSLRDSFFEDISFLTETIEDYFQFGDPQPPLFKFREEISSLNNIKTENDQELFEFLCRKGLEDRFSELNIVDKKIYIDRLEFEMNVIKNMKFPGYMLIVWDFVNHAKNIGVPVGPGRGSAAGSLVSFSLKISNIDPIKYRLLFERFLNPDRVSFPDIDMDFSQEGRGKIIDYVSDKYGKECVAQVITFGKIGGKSSIRDAARSYHAPLYLADKIAKTIPEKPGMTLAKAKSDNKDFWDKWQKEDYQVDKIINGAEKISGFTRNLGVHAAGLIIGTVPIYKKAPVYTIGDAQVVGFDGKYLEDVDLVKFDFLGLKTLDVIDNTIKLIKKEKSVEIDFNKVDIEDKGVYDFVCKGNNLGIFQIESPGMRGLAKSLQPDRFEEFIAMLALYRPGPMEAGMLQSFIDRKHGREKVSYFFKDMEKALKPILEPTYGLIVYQEQVMQIVQAIAGFSLGEADIVRRAMGKKKAEEMERISIDFANRAEKKGYKKEEAIELFNLIEKFAGYGFNKSHSAAYAMITFQTAYLKTYYPLEFFTALLNTEIGDRDKISMYITEAKDLGIEIIKPDIRFCKSIFTIFEGKIAFGLKSIKGVGQSADIFIEAVKHFGPNDLNKILMNTQVDKESQINLINRKIERLNKNIQNIEAKHSKSILFLDKIKDKGNLTDYQETRRKAHVDLIAKYGIKKTEIEAEITELKNSLVEINSLGFNSEKISKKIFEPFAKTGALSCFGYTRKALVENTVALLNPTKLKNAISDISSMKEEYSKTEIMQLEEDFTGVIFQNPFSEDFSKFDIEEDNPLAIVLDKISKQKKDGKEYLNVKCLLHTGKIIEFADFNQKMQKYDIGSEVQLSLSLRGNYINLSHVQKIKKENLIESKKTIKITVLDEIPKNISEKDTVEVYDLNNKLFAILS